MVLLPGRGTRAFAEMGWVGYTQEGILVDFVHSGFTDDLSCLPYSNTLYI